MYIQTEFSSYNDSIYEEKYRKIQERIQNRGLLRDLCMNMSWVDGIVFTSRLNSQGSFVEMVLMRFQGGQNKRNAVKRINWILKE